MARAAVLQPVGRVGRRTRRPQHTFNVRHRPWQITPFMIAPVLPGETLKNILFQSRCVTDPIKNPLVGWWIEYYFFYVKHRDLDDRDLFTSMMLDVESDTSSLNTAAKTETYHRATSIDWVQLCLNRVRDTYFRDEDEIGTAFNIGNLPITHIGQQTLFDSLVPEDHFGASTDVSLTVGGDDAITASEVDAMMRSWEFLRAQKLTDASYEDYLATFGISKKPEEAHRPELIRYFREWQYPSNTIDPTNGAPTSAVSWSVTERADKDRFFREPGFICGYTVARPKVYLDNQQSTFTSEMNNAISWLPAILSDDPYTSVKQFAAGSSGPIAGATDGYWVDIKDLFLYGEQFVNYAFADLTSKVDLPDIGIANKRYADAADADSFFVTPATKNFIRQDGIAHLDILTLMTDTTPQGIQSGA